MSSRSATLQLCHESDLQPGRAADEGDLRDGDDGVSLSGLHEAGADGRQPGGHDGNNPLSWNPGAVSFNYSESGAEGTDNNGNVIRAAHYIPNGDTGDYRVGAGNHNWYYSYDSLNRLTRGTEYNTSGAEQFKQSFSYDRWGNRTIDVTNTTNLPGITRDTFTVDATNNRLTAKNGVAVASQCTAWARSSAAGRSVTLPSGYVGLMWIIRSDQLCPNS